MVKSAMIVIDTVWVQNLLAPFCCVFEKDILLCLSVLANSPKFQSYLHKKPKKKISTGQQYLVIFGSGLG